MSLNRVRNVSQLLSCVFDKMDQTGFSATPSYTTKNVLKQKENLMGMSTYKVVLCLTLILPRLAFAVVIETVPVRNAGNTDKHPFFDAYGGVSYEFKIGKYEVTNHQYVDFLNAVDPRGRNSLELYDARMSSDTNGGGIDFGRNSDNGSKYVARRGHENNPVVYVSWYDSIRFANWLHNGQGNGSTETGAYTILGGTAIPSNIGQIARNPNSHWFLPTEDEWYKAAYHKNDGPTGNYWNYPTSTDDVPYSDQPPGRDAPDQSNTVNSFSHDGIPNGYNDGFANTGRPQLDRFHNYFTDVGAYTQSDSAYGTFDQAGNAWEWTETGVGGSRRLRGGDFFVHQISSSDWLNQFEDSAALGFGFRVAGSLGGSPPIDGDLNWDGNVDVRDVDLLSEGIRDGVRDPRFDFDRSGILDRDDLNFYVEHALQTWLGDSNLDGEFNSSDLVLVFQIQEYEDQIRQNSGWRDGDWTGDGEFDSSDLVAAFQGSGFERGQRAAIAVPETSAVPVIPIIVMIGLFAGRGPKV